MFKKLLLIFLSLTMLLIPLLSSCSNEKGSGTQTTKGPDAPMGIGDVTVDTWMSEGYNKVASNDRKPKELLKSFKLSAAKNEAESCHVTVRTSEDVDNLKISLVSGSVDNITVELLEEHLIKVGMKKYPDPIVPFDGEFDTVANENKGILIRFRTNAQTKAGTYEYKFKLTDAIGTVIDEYTVELKVWDFALPETVSCFTAGDIREDQVSSKERVPQARLKGLYKKYYDMLLDYNFNAHDLPYDILDDRADEYMSNPRVTGFRVDYTLKDEKLIEIYEKLKTNPEWLEKAYFYVYDEPNDVDALNLMAERVRRLNELCPEIDILVAFFRNVKYDENRDQIDFMAEYVDMFCAKSAAWGEKWLPDPYDRGYFGDRMKALKEQGKEISWYVCWEPGYPYCNMYVNEAGVQHRELFWQQYYYESDGFLYWSTTYWTETENPWEDMANVKSLSDSVYGDGSLLYPGKHIEVDGPVASIRLECIRDGVEDFDLLKLAEQYLGREWVVEQIKKVSESLTVHTKDNELFAETRNAIGDAIESAIKNS